VLCFYVSFNFIRIILLVFFAVATKIPHLFAKLFSEH
jgi:hypothetical protein